MRSGPERLNIHKSMSTVQNSSGKQPGLFSLSGSGLSVRTDCYQAPPADLTGTEGGYACIPPYAGTGYTRPCNTLMEDHFHIPLRLSVLWHHTLLQIQY